MKNIEQGPSQENDEMTPEQMEEYVENTRNMWDAKLNSEREKATDQALEVSEQQAKMLEATQLAFQRRILPEQRSEVANATSDLLRILDQQAHYGRPEDDHIPRERVEELIKLLNDAVESLRG